MHQRRLAAATALLISTTSFVGISVASAHATTASILYVDNTSSHCADTGTGTQAAPYCTIQAAADAVQPGQTVLIGGWGNDYNEDVKVKTSGTASAPITFASAHGYFTDATPDHDFTLTGVSNIVISGLYGDSINDSVLVSGSSNITIENSTLRQSAATQTSTIAAVHVTGASNAVTVERDWFETFNGPNGEGVRIDGGSTNTLVATNYVGFYGYSGVDVVGASGTDIVGNTFGNVLGPQCGPGISITSGSTSTSVENNVIANITSQFFSCAAGSQSDGLLVSADSAAGTSAQYNVFSTDGGGTTPYLWAGTAYTTAGAFQAATGKGVADDVVSSVDLSTHAIPSGSPLIDSADANAPGETATDIYGNARVDDSSTPNTGTGSGYYDRGAIEYQEYTSSSMTLGLDSAQHVIAAVHMNGVPWGSTVTDTIDWGDGHKDTNPDSFYDTDTDFTSWFGGSHEYASRGTYSVTETITDDAGTRTLTGTISTTGSTYTPITPTRVLDTRHGIGTGGSSQPVPAGSAIAFSVTDGVAGAPAPDTITAVVLNVTVTAPSGGGYITVYPDGTVRPKVSSLDFNAGQTVPNLVTVKVGADGKVALYNGSGGTAHLIADVEGYYTATSSGSGFTPVSPTRLLDTRKGTGTGGSTKPVPAGGTLSLKVEGNNPVPGSGVSAVVLNVTVTAPVTGGYITVFPGGATRPTASNLDFSAGQTAANLVTVPVGSDGTVSLYNGSGGTAHLIADVFGYYTATGGDAFVPMAPFRVLDTRTGLGQFTQPHPVPANGNQDVSIEGGEAAVNGGVPVYNVTVTTPTASGYITAYPTGTTVPTVSNLDFSPGQTVANQVIATNPTTLHNGSGGTVNLIADVFGYFS